MQYKAHCHQQKSRQQCVEEHDSWDISFYPVYHPIASPGQPSIGVLYYVSSCHCVHGSYPASSVICRAIQASIWGKEILRLFRQTEVYRQEYNFQFLCLKGGCTICSIRDKECSVNKQCKHDAADDSLLDYRKR